MNLCKNCKHCRVDTAWLTRQKFYYCRKHITIEQNKVTGAFEETGPEIRCWVERAGYGDCGPEGKYWEAKE